MGSFSFFILCFIFLVVDGRQQKERNSGTVEPNTSTVIITCKSATGTLEVLELTYTTQAAQIIINGVVQNVGNPTQIESIIDEFPTWYSTNCGGGSLVNVSGLSVGEPAVVRLGPYSHPEAKAFVHMHQNFMKKIFNI